VLGKAGTLFFNDGNFIHCSQSQAAVKWWSVTQIHFEDDFTD